MILTTDIVARFALKRYARSWRGRCPVCGYHNTLIIREGRDGRALFSCVSCRDRTAVAAALTRAVPQECSYDLKTDLDESTYPQRMQMAALRLWHRSAPAPGTPAEIYLIRRGLPDSANSAALRFQTNCSHPEGGKLAAMVALVTSSAGRPLGVHRTYIQQDGCKAPVVPAKASLGPVWSGAIRMGDIDPERPLLIGEGIETAASAGRMMKLPAWAAISAGNLAKGLALPPNVCRVVIAVDPDAPGRAAAQDASTRWTAEGRDVQFALPDTDRDFNDIMMAADRG